MGSIFVNSSRAKTWWHKYCYNLAGEAGFESGIGDHAGQDADRGGQDRMSWVAAVDYRRGRDHVQGGLPCQDFGLIDKPDETLVAGVVTDGAGAARYSHFGARAAAALAIHFLHARAPESWEAAIARLREFGGADLAHDIVGAVRRGLEEEAALRGCRLEDLACTMLAFLAWPEGVISVRVGDSYLIRGIPSRLYRVVGDGGDGGDEHESLFVTDPEAAGQAVVTVETGPISFLAATTDGLAPVSIRGADGQPDAPFFRPLDDYVAAARDDDEVHRGIRALLRSERLAALVEDDATLLVCGWSDAPGQPPRAPTQRA